MMKKTVGDDNTTLFHVALMISKKTSTIATIKYGEVTLSSGDIEIAILFDDIICQPQLIITKVHNHFSWRLTLPSKLFLSVERIEAIASIVLGVTRSHSAKCPIVSVPTNYLDHLFSSKEICLDQSFVITDSDIQKAYVIRNNGDDFSLTILGNKAPFSYDKIYLMPRSIKGNE